MSDVMLLGVLRMPVPYPVDAVWLHQFVDRARQAAARIESDADEIERLRAALEAEKDEVFRLQSSHSALYAEVEALRKDAERWRYVVTHAEWIRHDDGRDMYSSMAVRLPYEADQSCVATRTDAIDAAMKEPK